jgi:integrase
VVGKHGRHAHDSGADLGKGGDRHLDRGSRLHGGVVFRPVNRGDEVCGERLSEKVVWWFLRRYAEAVGVPGIAPHDARRTCAKLCRAAGGELEQIQLLLGHAFVQTTERYRGTKQDLVHAPKDGITLRVAV